MNRGVWRYDSYVTMVWHICDMYEWHHVTSITYICQFELYVYHNYSNHTHAINLLCIHIQTYNDSCLTVTKTTKYLGILFKSHVLSTKNIQKERIITYLICLTRLLITTTYILPNFPGLLTTPTVIGVDMDFWQNKMQTLQVVDRISSQFNIVDFHQHFLTFSSFHKA